jgi:peptidoglycan/xylan/chitin deacetylase (PgdA/CDA1 family)
MRSLTPIVRRVLALGQPPGGTVLLYHRIADLASDPQCLAVSPAHFAEHLDVLARHGVPMTLSSMLSRARQGTLPSGAVAITFDDGYADNFEVAAPMLSRAGMPATMFLCTDPIVNGREFWWDEIERDLLGAGTLPQRLRLTIGETPFEWDLTGATDRTASDCTRDAGWTVTRGSCPTPRHRAYVDVCARLQPVDAATRERTLAELASIAGHSRTPRSSHRPMSVAEVAALGQVDDITIGSHTVSHPALSNLSPQMQRDEIAGARRMVEEIIGGPATSLAYPFGGRREVSRQTLHAARDAGIAMACSTAPGVVDATTDCLSVPRVVVRDSSGSEFEQRILALVGGVTR